MKWPVFDEDQRQAVQRVLESGKVNYWTGEEGRAFEREFADQFGAKHSVAMGNGTLALDVALRAIDVKAGDEVIVTPRSFMASASCVSLLGARPVFVDVDPDSQNIEAAQIAPAITDATKAIIAVHLAGWPCAMGEIVELAESHGVVVVEDCAQAHGATIDGQSVGTFGAVAAYSFCQDKIMTTGGEGGMVMTNSDALYERIWEFKDHGKSLAKMNQPAAGREFRYVHDSIGSNYRMTEMQAALGRIQLERLEGWLAIRSRNAEIWQQELAGLDVLRIPRPGPALGHAYYKLYAFIEPERLGGGWTRNRIIDEAARVGVQCFSGSCPEIYREQAFEGLQEDSLPVAKRLGETSLMLLVDPTFDEAAIRQQAQALRGVLEQATA